MIRVRGLSFTVGGFSLREVSLEVGSGEYFVLLGPTGAGKTLFAECLCGLIRPSRGSIEIDGREVAALAPRHRGIGYVPQHQGLFPHLSVRENIAFALRARRAPRGEIAERRADLARLLGIEGLLERWPAHLSGGERQKVALARALAARPRLLILDEPVSAVDEPSRETLCAELRRIQRELQITTLHVSHNLEEAFSVGDRAGLLQDGRLLQAGPIGELLRRPATEFVARFFRTENLFRAEATPRPDGHSELRFSGHLLRAPGQRRGQVTFAIRPEAVQVLPAGAEAPNGLPAVLTRVSDRGPYRRFEFDAGAPVVSYATTDAAALAGGVGQRVVLAFPAEAIHILPGVGGQGLGVEGPEHDR